MIDIQTTLYNWANDYLASIGNAMSVVWTHQNAPRPQLPYVDFHILNLESIGQYEKSQIDNDGNAVIISRYMITITVSCFADDATDKLYSINIIDKLKSSLSNSNIVDNLNNNGITIVNNTMNINYFPTLVATGFESRAMTDIVFGIATTSDINLGVIETVAGTGVINDNIIIDYNA